jgi:Fic family protein
MDLERFRDSPAGRLVQATAGETTYWAFCPNPLPPALPLDAELVRTLSEADRALGELAGLGHTMPNPHLLIGPFLRHEAVLSSRIEGTVADLSDLYVYEAGPAVATDDSDVREVHNYVAALEYGLERLEELPISLRLIRELHECLMQGVRGERATPGEFRQVQNWIGARRCPLPEADFVPPPVPEMHEALDALERYIHSEDVYPPLIRLALIHYQFETIHPFLDGNGRIGRLLITLLLASWKLLPVPLLYLSAYFERRRETYYDLLLAVSERGDWPAWVRFFLLAVAEQARDAIRKARRLQELQNEWRARLRQKRITGLAVSITDLLFSNPVVAPNEVVERFHVSHQAAMQALRRLEKVGLVREASGRQRNRAYLAEEVVRLVE